MNSVGLIGIGQMGMPMGKNLLKAGYSLNVYARNKSSMDPLLSLGARSADTPRDVFASSETVLLALPAPKDVKEIIFGQNGLVSENPTENRIIIDTSTLDPKSSREIATSLESVGVNYLDAPVSGGPEGAANATLTFMVGGKRQVFDRCKPLFEMLGRNIVYLGPSGSGTGAKLVNQLLVASGTIATAEAMQLSKALGLDSDQVIDVIRTSAGDSFIFRRVAPKIAKDDLAGGWLAYLMDKDLRLLSETQRDLGLPSVSVKSSIPIFSEAVRSGMGNLDSANLIKVLDKMRSN